MTRRVGRITAALVLVLLPGAAVLGPAAVGVGASCADAATSPHAALVVDTGSGVHDYCVVLDASHVSGIHLIELASTQKGLTYRLGSGGLVVCMLAGVGNTGGGDCLTGQTTFWGYWLGDGSGGWVWSSSGAGSVQVGSGDVQGWSWGPGLDGSTHPQPPATTIGQVCPPASPTPTPAPTGGGGSGGGGSPGGSPAADTASTSSPATWPGSAAASPSGRNVTRTAGPPESPSPARADPARAATVPPTVIAAAGITAANGGGGGGPPATSLLAVALALFLGLAGYFRVRSRATRREAGAPP